MKKCKFTEPMVPVCSRVPKKVLEDLRRIANSQNETVSAFLCKKILVMTKDGEK